MKTIGVTLKFNIQGSLRRLKNKEYKRRGSLIRKAWDWEIASLAVPKIPGH
jgi:hypothetical protein